jgi:long-chain fatty acid transport protein
MRNRHAVILVAIALLAAAPAFASGFGFYEQSAKASAQGGAWVARADDAAANWYNPAALVHLSGREVQFGTNWLDIGSDTSFTPTGGGSTIDAVGNNAFPSYFYFSQKINDRVAWGVGLNNPFGLTSEWQDAPLTYSSKRAELATYLLNPNIAFAINKRWSFAIGIDYLSAEVQEFSRDLLLAGTPTSNLTGEGDGFGWNAALQYKMDCFSIAASYRSAMNPVIEGNLTVSGPLGNVLNSPASAKVALPAQTMVGAAWTGKRVDVELGAYYTEWNVFKELAIETNSPATTTTLAEDWTGTWSYRLGVAVRLDAALQHELRFGGVLDDSPIPDYTLRPSIPDSDRTGYTLGYGWQGKHFGVDIYGMQLDFDDKTAVNSGVNGSGGVFNGTYKSSILLVGGTFKYRF